MKTQRLSLKLVKKQDGTAAIEFALVAPVMFMFIFGIIEFGLIIFNTSYLENATNIASRLGRTGYEEEGVDREDMIIAAIEESTNEVFDPSQIDISYEYYSQFDHIGKGEEYFDTNGSGQYDLGEPYTEINGNGQWDAELGQDGLGEAGDVVVYTVTYPWKIMTPILQPFFLSSDGVYEIRSSIIVRNEPYDVEGFAVQ
jgi:hypothetical protein